MHIRFLMYGDYFTSRYCFLPCPDAGLEEISRLFKQGSYSEELSSQLEGLDLEGNEVTGSSFASSGFTSAYDCPLIFLNISCNPISIGGQNLISDIISKNKVLRQLSLNSCGLEMKSLINITSNLLENSTLQLLYIVISFLLHA
jgi:hypothetical protein